MTGEVLRHADHEPALICRPAGNGLCEPLPGAVDVMDAPLYSDRELLAAVTAGRKRLLAEVRQLARERGAVYFAEPRPCTCKRGCAQVTRKRMPFDDLLAKLDQEKR